MAKRKKQGVSVKIEKFPRGATRMRQLGHKLVQVWLDPAEYDAVLDASRLECVKLSTYVRRGALEDARAVLRFGPPASPEFHQARSRKPTKPRRPGRKKTKTGTKIS
jgi:hypothetical protein